MELFRYLAGSMFWLWMDVMMFVLWVVTALVFYRVYLKVKEDKAKRGEIEPKNELDKELNKLRDGAMSYERFFEELKKGDGYEAD